MLAPISDHDPVRVDIPNGATLYDEDGTTPVGKTDTAKGTAGTLTAFCVATVNGTKLYGLWVSVTDRVYGVRFAGGTNPRPVTAPVPGAINLGPGLYRVG